MHTTILAATYLDSLVATARWIQFLTRTVLKAITVLWQQLPLSAIIGNEHTVKLYPSGRQRTEDRVPVVRIRSSGSAVTRVFHENGSATNSPGCNGSLAPPLSASQQPRHTNNTLDMKFYWH